MPKICDSNLSLARCFLFTITAGKQTRKVDPAKVVVVTSDVAARVKVADLGAGGRGNMLHAGRGGDQEREERGIPA